MREYCRISERVKTCTRSYSFDGGWALMRLHEACGMDNWGYFRVNAVRVDKAVRNGDFDDGLAP